MYQPARRLQQQLAQEAIFMNGRQAGNEFQSDQASEQHKAKSVDDLVHESRQLAQDFMHAKRNEFEEYAQSLIKQGQDTLVQALDDSLEQLAGLTNKFLNRLDRRPILTLAVGLVVGGMLGLRLAGRSGPGFGKDISSANEKVSSLKTDAQEMAS